MKATDAIPLLDLRRLRAQALAAAIMDEVIDVVPEVDRRAVYDRLFSVLHQSGASWTTDEERNALGLEPRDMLGWTPSARVAEKRRRLEVLQMIASGGIYP